MQVPIIVAFLAFCVQSAVAGTNCEDRAVDLTGKPLYGAAKAAAIKKCEAADKSSDTSKLSCEERAFSNNGKPLAGAARETFIRACKATKPQYDMGGEAADCKSGTLTLKKASDGHFYVSGALNGVALRFLIDTGASITTISPNFASKAGIVGSRPARFNTAAGEVSGSIANDVALSLGTIQFRKANIAVNPSYTEQFGLLGQNIIGKFAVSINGSEMKLVADQASGIRNCVGDAAAEVPSR